MPEACKIVERLFEFANVQWLQPGPRTVQILSEICADGQVKGALVMDAHLAALAREHGAVVATADKDFRRFLGIRTTNPLADGAAV